MSLSITSHLIIDAAQKRGWEVKIIHAEDAFYRIRQPSGETYYVRSNATRKMGSTNTYITKNKDVLYAIAAELGVRIPETVVATDDRDGAFNLLHKYPLLVVKPADQGHGDGITVGITNEAELTKALEYAERFSKRVLVQQHIAGDDYRVLCIDKKLAAAAIRKPAFVTGDGEHTLGQLIDIENQSARRASGYSNLLTSIELEQATRYLGDRIDEIAPAGEEVRVMGISNVGKGGVALDVTDELPAGMIEAALAVIEHLDIGLCGVDFMMGDDNQPYMIEMNLMPSFGLHEHPYRGRARQTPDKFLDWLIKDN
ncbi:MAG: family N-acetyltransferase [Candidatus Saccharibacteria bacterium]|nr:family N-acetyltransferase [Candidatus Saccharibacteria bacterium]